MCDGVQKIRTKALARFSMELESGGGIWIRRKQLEVEYILDNGKKMAVINNELENGGNKEKKFFSTSSLFFYVIII